MFGHLDGRAALVTGAGQGNGKAIAVRLAEAGADVAVNDLNEETATETARLVEAHGRRALVVRADVAALGEVDAMVRRCGNELGRLDILVNNAGLIVPNPFGSVTESDWDRTFAVNAKGLFFCMQSAADIMKRAGWGRIINISSMAGRGVPSMSPPYAASKAAVIALSQQAARTLARSNITVNAICPGIIDTPFNQMLDEVIGVGQQGLPKGEFLKQRAASVPMGRLGRPEEIADLVVFLASEEAAYITGATINIDGGDQYN